MSKCENDPHCGSCCSYVLLHRQASWLGDISTSKLLPLRNSLYVKEAAWLQHNFHAGFIKTVMVAVWPHQYGIDVVPVIFKINMYCVVLSTSHLSFLDDEFNLFIIWQLSY